MAQKTMTVADLKKALQQFNDEDRIVINIMQENKSFGVHQYYPQINDHFPEEQPYHRYQLQHSYGGCTFNAWLPDGMYTVQRKP